MTTAVVRCRGRIVFGDEADELRRVILGLLKETTVFKKEAGGSGKALFWLKSSQESGGYFEYWNNADADSMPSRANLRRLESLQ
jgi:hypothetical protein